MTVGELIELLQRSPPYLTVVAVVDYYRPPERSRLAMDYGCEDDELHEHSVVDVDRTGPDGVALFLS